LLQTNKKNLRNLIIGAACLHFFAYWCNWQYFTNKFRISGRSGFPVIPIFKSFLLSGHPSPFGFQVIPVNPVLLGLFNTTITASIFFVLRTVRRMLLTGMHSLGHRQTMLYRGNYAFSIWRLNKNKRIYINRARDPYLTFATILTTLGSHKSLTSRFHLSHPSLMVFFGKKKLEEALQ
jgi:hypothetical protein